MGRPPGPQADPWSASEVELENLSGVSLVSVTLSGSDLRRANLPGVEIDGTREAVGLIPTERGANVKHAHHPILATRVVIQSGSSEINTVGAEALLGLLPYGGLANLNCLLRRESPAAGPPAAGDALSGSDLSRADLPGVKIDGTREAVGLIPAGRAANVKHAHHPILATRVVIQGGSSESILLRAEASLGLLSNGGLANLNACCVVKRCWSRRRERLGADLGGRTCPVSKLTEQEKL